MSIVLCANILIDKNNIRKKMGVAANFYTILQPLKFLENFALINLEIFTIK